MGSFGETAKKNSQLAVAVHRWFQSVVSFKVSQELMVMNPRVGRLPPGHDLPHGDPKGPLVERQELCLARVMSMWKGDGVRYSAM